MSQKYGVFLLALLLPACSVDLPSTRMVDLTGADGTIQRVREVQTPSGSWVECNSGNGGRILVRDSERRLQYAGQALMNQTCARGQCHTSIAVGELRSGVPHGMDFDLPLTPPVSDPTRVQDVWYLSVHQRKVYDWRHNIWDQVAGDHMPPEGAGTPFRGGPGLTFVELDQSLVCTDLGPVEPITDGDTRWILGAWLACGSPVVETSDVSVLTVSAAEVGLFMPACVAGIPDPDLDGGVPNEVTFDDVYTEVLLPQCSICHFPGGPGLGDYSTPDVAFANLTGYQTENSCGGPEEVVTPGAPEESYLLHKMGDTDLGEILRCGGVMPPGGSLATGTALVREWIENGAPGPD